MTKATYTVTEASELLGVSRQTFLKWANSGDCPVPIIRVVGKFLVPAAPLRELLGLSPLAEDGAE